MLNYISHIILKVLKLCIHYWHYSHNMQVSAQYMHVDSERNETHSRTSRQIPAAFSADYALMQECRFAFDNDRDLRFRWNFLIKLLVGMRHICPC